MQISKGKNFTDEHPVLVLKDVFLYYMQHAPGGVPKYGKKGIGLVEREFTTQILVDVKVAKAIKKFHKKLSVKQYDAEEFEEQFRVEPPFEADNYVVIRASANAGYLDKSTNEQKPLNPPKVLSRTREDLSGVKIGNGSKATVGLNITPYEHPEFGKGTSLNLGMVVVSELIEYVGSNTEIDDEDDFDFEEDEFDGMTEGEEEAPKDKAKAPVVEEEAEEDLL